jgi:Tol biopolymer transport system component
VPAAPVATGDSARLLLVLGQGSDGTGASPGIRAVRVDRPNPPEFTLESVNAHWSPDGRYIAFSGLDRATLSKVILLHIIGREDTVSIFADDRVIMPGMVWSPKSDAVGVLTYSIRDKAEFVVIDAARRAVLRRYELPDSIIEFGHFMDAVRWAPDGSAVLISSDAAVILDLADGAVTYVSRTPVIAEWMPDGRGIYFFETTNHTEPLERKLGGFFMRRRDAAGAVALASRPALDGIGLRESPFVTARMELSPSGRQLAVVAGSAGDSTGIRLYAMNPGTPFDITKPARTLWIKALVTSVEWSPDETRLAIVTAGEPGITIDQIDLRTGRKTALSRLDFPGARIVLLLLYPVISWTR